LDALSEAEADLRKAREALNDRDSPLQESLTCLSNAIIHVGEAVGELSEQVSG
jgi:hypothetical protein